MSKIADALSASGARVLRAPDPRWAPFELLAQAPGGEILDLLCYAFTANEYRQRGRPVGEHRFQVKYGSEFHRYHNLFFDPERHRITLMFGVHDDLPLFIAVDPRMHSPTRFSSSVELKRAALDQALETGWHGWQRDRKEARRKRAMPELDLRAECIIAFRPEHFLRYVYFERMASGMECGERLSLSDSVETDVAAGKALPAQTPLSAHRLESVLGLSASEVLQVIGDRFRLMAAVRGGVAEHHLGKLLAKVPGISDLERLDRDGYPDFALRYRQAPVKIECKNVLARLTRGKPKVDFQRTRHAKDDPCSRYYKRTEFDLLAACLHPITGQWEFKFHPTRTLQAHSTCAGRLSQIVYVESGDWLASAKKALDEVTA